MGTPARLEVARSAKNHGSSTAREVGIDGRWTMNTSELIDALRNH